MIFSSLVPTRIQERARDAVRSVLAAEHPLYRQTVDTAELYREVPTSATLASSVRSACRTSTQENPEHAVAVPQRRTL